MSDYPNMPEPDGFILFDGDDHPYWIVEHNDEAIKVSTAELQERLFVGGDTDGDYVNARAEQIDEDIAFFIDPDESVDTVKDAVWGVKSRKTGNPRWSVIGNCLYNGDDFGSLVAECASAAIAAAMAEHANANPELRRKVHDAR